MGSCGMSFLTSYVTVFGARSRNRTGMTLRSRDFKSLVSTSSTIRAYWLSCLFFIADRKRSWRMCVYNSVVFDVV